jgi:hypothetical protein
MQMQEQPRIPGAPTLGEQEMLAEGAEDWLHRAWSTCDPVCNAAMTRLWQ